MIKEYEDRYKKKFNKDAFVVIGDKKMYDAEFVNGLATIAKVSEDKYNKHMKELKDTMDKALIESLRERIKGGESGRR